MDVSGRVAVITGASSGIGLAIARHFAREGVAVVLGARRAERLDEAVREIRDMGQKHEGQMTLGDLGLGPLILPRIGPGGSIGPFGPDIGGIRPKWR